MYIFFKELQHNLTSTVFRIRVSPYAAVSISSLLKTCRKTKGVSPPPRGKNTACFLHNKHLGKRCSTRTVWICWVAVAFLLDLCSVGASRHLWKPEQHRGSPTSSHLPLEPCVMHLVTEWFCHMAAKNHVCILPALRYSLPCESIGSRAQVVHLVGAAAPGAGVLSVTTAEKCIV